MNALLKDVFTEEAEAAGDPNIDLTTVIRTGTRRTRQRRVVTAIATVAAAAAVIAGGTTVVRHTAADQTLNVPIANQPDAAESYVERRATWATGDTIHYGADVLRVGSEIAAFVQTDAGFVAVDAKGAVYRVTSKGSEQIGSGNTTHLLTADATGPLVGWVDATPKIPQFVLYDVAAKREVGRTTTGNRSGAAAGDNPVRVSAIDGGTAYLAASDGLHRWPIAGSSDLLLKPEASPDLVQAAGGGQLVWKHPATGGSTDLAVGTDVNAAYPRHYVGRQAYLSPSAHYLVTGQTGDLRLFDLGKDRELMLKFPSYVEIFPTQWKSETEFFAVAYRSQEADPLDLLTCSTTALTCKVTTSKFISSQVSIQLPTGTPLA